MLAMSIIVQITFVPMINGQFFTKSQAKSVPRMGRRSELNTHHASIPSIDPLYADESNDESKVS